MAIIYGNVANNGFFPQLLKGAAVEVPCVVNANGIYSRSVTDNPPRFIGLMSTNLNVQGLTVQALLDEDRDLIYNFAMLDPRVAAE